MMVEMTLPEGQPATERRTSGLAIASFVLGAVGFLMAYMLWLPGDFYPLYLPQWMVYPQGVAFILAIVFGAVAWRRINRNPRLKGKAFAIAGLAIGIAIPLFYALMFLALILVLSSG